MLKRFIAYYRPHRGLFLLDMAAAAAASLLQILFPLITRHLLQSVIPEGMLVPVIHWGAVLLGLYLLVGYFTYIRIKWGHILGVRMESTMRQDIFYHLQKLSFSYYDRTKTGHLMSRISNDLNRITEVAHHAPEDLLISAVVILGAFTAMFFTSPAMAFITLIPLPLMVGWGILQGGKLKNRFRGVRRRIADINAAVENSVQGIREVKAYANEDVEIEKFDRVNYRFRRAKEDVYGQMGRFHSVMQFLRNSYYLTVVIGGSLLIHQGSLTAADLAVFLLYVSLILPPIDRLINFVEQMSQGAAAFERFIEVMDIEPDLVDSPGAADLSRVEGEIALEDVSFRYEPDSPEAGKEVLRDIRIKVAAGETAAIAGESGAGKSTLVSLLCRFYDPCSGRVLLDGRPLPEIKQRVLRDSVGIVQQEAFLFDDTVRQNILYGRPDASEEEMVEAAEKAYIRSFIEGLPQGWDTPIGERGVRLSGGQRQRLALARIFLKNPPVLIFDEATSALDSESEGYIQKALEELSRDRTTIIIAHRLSTIRNASRIFVMKEGRVVEEGSHRELLSAGGYYAGLYSRHLV